MANTRPAGWIRPSTLFYLTVLTLHSALWRQLQGWCGPWWKWVWYPLSNLSYNALVSKVESTREAKGMWKENIRIPICNYFHQKLEIKLYKYLICGSKLALCKTIITCHIYSTEGALKEKHKVLNVQEMTDTLLTCWLFLTILWHIWQFLRAQFSGILDGT